MFRRTFPILLAVVIAACPVTCQVIAFASHDCAGEAAGTAGGCDNCCRAAENGSGDDRGDTPVPCCPCREKGQNCICNGAVIDGDDGYQYDLLPSLDSLVDLFPSALSATGVYGESSHEDNPLPVISGRHVRALISSFLC